MYSHKMATDVNNANSEIFTGGVSRKQIIYEDDQCIVFDEDNYRQAPVHFTVTPKKILPRLSEASTEDEKLLGHLLLIAKKLAMENKLDITGYHVMVDENYRTMRFNGLHVFGRALHHMLWPVGPGCRL